MKTYKEVMTEAVETVDEAKKRNESLFNMDDVTKVVSMNLDDAKAYVKNKLDSTKIKVTPSGKSKIMSMMQQAKTAVKLGQKMSDFILAHPGEGLKTIKPGDK
jgi:hypothetical protein